MKIINLKNSRGCSPGFILHNHFELKKPRSKQLNPQSIDPLNDSFAYHFWFQFYCFYCQFSRKLVCNLIFSQICGQKTQNFKRTTATLKNVFLFILRFYRKFFVKIETDRLFKYVCSFCKSTNYNHLFDSQISLTRVTMLWLGDARVFLQLKWNRKISVWISRYAMSLKLFHAK